MRPTMILTLFALSAGFAACGGETAEGPEPGAGTVPHPLMAVESGGEDAYDQALAGDFPAVSDTAAAVEERWGAFRPEAASDGASPETLRAMDDAVAGLGPAAEGATDRVAVARAANAVSAPMADLFALYDPPVPAAVLELDYLGRQVALDAMDGTDPGSDLDTLESTWSSLKPDLVDAGGADVAAAYDESVASMRASMASGDDAALRTAADDGLEIVDDMERVFASR